DVLLVRDIHLDAAFERAQVGDGDGRACGRETRRDRCADPLCAAGDERDLPLQAAHLNGENEVGIRMRFSWVWISGWTFARNATHASSACSSRRRLARSSKSSYAQMCV